MSYTITNNQMRSLIASFDSTTCEQDAEYEGDYCLSHKRPLRHDGRCMIGTIFDLHPDKIPAAPAPDMPWQYNEETGEAGWAHPSTTVPPKGPQMNQKALTKWAEERTAHYKRLSTDALNSRRDNDYHYYKGMSTAMKETADHTRFQ